MNFGDPRLPERFWSKVAPCPMSGCWIWTAYVDVQGYGKFSLGGRSGRLYRPHRVAYEALVSPIQDGMVLDHLCRVRSCCNPAHLEAVTQAENVHRGLSGVARAAKTHCPHGHEYAGENLRVTSIGSRVCRACSRATSKAWREASAAAC